MNTTAAAAEAKVTVATIRTWCRRGAVAAVKQAGRWIIDTASLAARIAIGAMRARKAAMTTTGTIIQMPDGDFGILGDAGILAAAFENGTPVTPTNEPYAGDRIYLGITRETRGDYGRTVETVGLAYTKDDGQAVYRIDTQRLASDAPAFYAVLEEMWDREEAAEAAAMSQDRDYFNPRYM
ncbi:helix-turn-helix domain-containing protein [Streptomyces sp. NPDC001910]|uniref:helix-turn-helix domain-containing protein n=1 Tax=Streptomyces sp. NPDC001910 TaxID=3154403 RepID=UPI00332CE469